MGVGLQSAQAKSPPSVDVDLAKRVCDLEGTVVDLKTVQAKAASSNMLADISERMDGLESTVASLKVANEKLPNGEDAGTTKRILEVEGELSSLKAAQEKLTSGETVATKRIDELQNAVANMKAAGSGTRGDVAHGAVEGAVEGDGGQMDELLARMGEWERQLESMKKFLLALQGQMCPQGAQESRSEYSDEDRSQTSCDGEEDQQRGRDPRDDRGTDQRGRDPRDYRSEGSERSFSGEETRGLSPQSARSNSGSDHSQSV